MSSLLEAITYIKTAPSTAKAVPAPPPASEPGLRLAMQLREVPAKSGGRVLLFVPAGRDGDASPVAGDAAAAFLEIQDGPVLLVDLRAEAFAAATPDWFDTLPSVERTQLTSNAALTSDTVRISRPLARRRDRAPYATTSRFAEQLSEARAQYRVVLYVGDPVPARDTLLAAAVADGVVIAVPPGHTSRTEMHDLSGQLRRARAKLTGFVLDPRAVDRGRTR